MTQATDAQLLQHFRAGDTTAFEELVRRHGPAIKGFAFRMVQNHERAEEVYVDTFTRVATAAAEWEERGTVRAWLFTIARRLCLDVLRRRATERRGLSGVLEIERFRAPAPSPEAALALGEAAAELERALSALPPEHREVLLLRTVHGLSAAETARTLGVAVDQVDSRLSYARKRLRVLLDEARSPRAEERR